MHGQKQLSLPRLRNELPIDFADPVGISDIVPVRVLLVG
jgi:hypothetical protein